MLLCASLIAQEIGWKVPFLPVQITYDFNEGFGIKGTSSMVTPIGEFSISTPSYNVSKGKSGNTYSDNNRVQTRSGNRYNYSRGYSSTRVKYVDKVKYVKVPVYKEVIKEVIVKEKEYLVILRDRNRNKDMAFLVKGVAEFEAVLKGKTTITAREGQIIIDITDTDYQEIYFKGRRVENPVKFTDKIFGLCNKYSEFGNGSLGEESFFFKKDISKSEYHRITSEYKVRNNKYETIAIIQLDDWRYDYDCPVCIGRMKEKLDGIYYVILSEDGIYWSPLEIYRKGIKKSFEADYNFTTWEEFARMRIKRVDDCSLSIEGYNGAYSNVGYLKSNKHLTSHEWELFFENLKDLANKHINE